MIATKIKDGKFIVQDGEVSRLVFVAASATAADAIAAYTESTTSPVLDLDGQKARKLNALAEMRWRMEYGGTVIQGTPVPTDDRTRSFLTGARILAKENASYQITSFKAGPGLFVTLDAVTIIAMADGVEAHIQACFDHENALSVQIMAAADETALAAVDINAGWP